jgi:hypothetical protein
VQWPQCVAVVGHLDAHRCKSVGDREDGSVGAAVRAEALRTEPPDDQPPGDHERSDRHDRSGERAPQVGRLQLQLPVGDRRQRLLLRPEPVLDDRPREHVAGDDPRPEHQQARAHRPWMDAELAEQPGAQVLHGDEMARPSTEEPAEHERAGDQRHEQHEAGVDAPDLDGLHRLGRLEGRHRLAGRVPVPDVQADQHVHRDQHVGALARHLRRPHRPALRLVPVLARQEHQRIADVGYGRNRRDDRHRSEPA